MNLKPKSSIVNKKIIDLKKSILESIFMGKSMPNANINLSFPDLEFFLSQPNQYIVDDELTASILMPQNNKKLEVIQHADLKKLTNLQDKTAFFQFDVIEKTIENLKIKLELKIIGADIKSVLPISTILLNFKKNKNDWDLVDGPVSLSS